MQVQIQRVGQDTALTQLVKAIDMRFLDYWAWSRMTGHDNHETNKFMVAAALWDAGNRGYVVNVMPKSRRKRLYGQAWVDGTIELNPEMPAVLELKVLIHEMAHVYLRHSGSVGMRRERELAAESVSYLVCANYGVRKLKYSSKYIWSWYKNMRLVEIAMDRQYGNIMRCTNSIISGMNGYTSSKKVA